MFTTDPAFVTVTLFEQAAIGNIDHLNRQLKWDISLCYMRNQLN